MGVFVFCCCVRLSVPVSPFLSYQNGVILSLHLVCWVFYILGQDLICLGSSSWCSSDNPRIYGLKEILFSIRWATIGLSNTFLGIWVQPQHELKLTMMFIKGSRLFVEIISTWAPVLEMSAFWRVMTAQLLVFPFLPITFSGLGFLFLLLGC